MVYFFYFDFLTRTVDPNVKGEEPQLRFDYLAIVLSLLFLERNGNWFKRDWDWSKKRGNHISEKAQWIFTVFSRLR